MPKFVFFGTPDFAVTILDQLEHAGFLPACIVTAPDKPQGRGLALTPPPVKVWGEERNIPVIQPTSLTELPVELTQEPWDVFIVAAYGKILSKTLLELPQYGTLNVHPSLLPKHRGASPIEGQILSGDPEVGVTIMEMDEELDHGPIVEKRTIPLSSFPIPKDELTNLLAHEGGKLLAEVLTPWCRGEITATPQEHGVASFTTKITKEDGAIDFTASAEHNYRTFCAYHPWPGTYFFVEKNGEKRRVKITDATYQDGIFLPRTVIPEGKQKMSYADFLKSDYTLPVGAPTKAA